MNPFGSHWFELDSYGPLPVCSQHVTFTPEGKHTSAQRMKECNTTGENRWQFIKELRKNPPQNPMPVVIFSAYGNPRAMAEELHVAGYLRKPFSVDELMAAIQSA